ncbi:MAG: serine/threonine protein kinase [Firmicutes bacterium]|nr:serine/threonine protein kinase [Bacillota bacterium]
MSSASSNLILKSQYEITERLGSGGMSSVFKAKNLKSTSSLTSTVAIKVMKKNTSFGRGLTQVEFFHKEAILLKELGHPALPRIYDLFNEKNTYYMVLEYIEGKTLEKYIEEKGRLSEEEAISIAIRLADIIEDLHSANPPLIYRDLKPSNIIMNENRMRLIDFSGVYFPFKGRLTSDVPVHSTGYSPPEAYKKGHVSFSVDTYALGKVIYQMLTGFNVGRTANDPEPIETVRPDISYELKYIINRAIQKNILSRYSTMWELRDELNQCLEKIKLRKQKNDEESKKQKIGDFLNYIYKCILLPLIDTVIALSFASAILFQVWAAYNGWDSKTCSLVPPWTLVALIVIFIIHALWRFWFNRVGAFHKPIKAIHKRVKKIKPMSVLAFINIIAFLGILAFIAKNLIKV